jgi:hypothetical protein
VLHSGSAVYNNLFASGFRVTGIGNNSSYLIGDATPQHEGESYVLTITGAVPEPSTLVMSVVGRRAPDSWAFANDSGNTVCNERQPFDEAQPVAECAFTIAQPSQSVFPIARAN